MTDKGRYTAPGKSKDTLAAVFEAALMTLCIRVFGQRIGFGMFPKMNLRTEPNSVALTMVLLTQFHFPIWYAVGNKAWQLGQGRLLLLASIPFGFARELLNQLGQVAATIGLLIIGILLLVKQPIMVIVRRLHIAMHARSFIEDGVDDVPRFLDFARSKPNIQLKLEKMRGEWEKAVGAMNAMRAGAKRILEGK